MKKIYTTLVAVLAMAHVSYAQNNSNPWPSSGNVGIGTQSPGTHKLAVYGDSGFNAGYFLGANTSNNSFGLTVQAGTSSADVAMQVVNRSFGTPYFLVRGDGNVGIGTTIPEGLLHLSSGYPSLIFDANSQGTNVKRTYIATSEVDAGDFVIGTRNDNNSVKSRNLYITNNGKVGIGTTSPGKQLDVNGDIRILGTNKLYLGPSTFEATLGYNGNGNLDITPRSGYNTIFTAGNVGIGTAGPGAPLEVNGSTTGDPTLIIRNSSYNGTNSTGTTALAFGFANHNGPKIEASKTATNVTSLKFYGEYGYNTPQEIMTLAANSSGGSVGIGTTSPDAKLTVNGTIHSKEVKVDTSIPVPDYVFEPAYKLLQLSELKTYLDANHHLPEIPSAAEMEKNGLNLSEMNLKLLKKVEELTLYLIEKDRQVTEQQKINQSLQQQIIQLAKKLNN